MKYLKKILCLWLALSIFLSVAIVPAGAAETTDPTEEVTEATEEETTEVTQETEEPTEATEPEDEETEETEPEETLPEEDYNSQSGSMSFESPAPEKKQKNYNQVPLFLQTDYRSVRYSDGTVATSGCTMACVAMVASWLRQEEILPDNLAKRFGKYDASNIQRMEAASIVLDLDFETAFDLWDVIMALKEGKVAILLMDAGSDFTNTQHTVVARGLTADGKLLIHDPYGPNYESSKLTEGFKNGFTRAFMAQGFSEAWIYDEYVEPEPRESRYPEMDLTDEELDLLARLIWLEARGESFQGQQAIAEIVFNRMAAEGFSDTLKGTIMAEGQFRTTKFLDDAEPGELQYKAIEMAISGPNVLPMEVYYFARERSNNHVWGRIDNHVFCYGDDGFPSK